VGTWLRLGFVVVALVLVARETVSVFGRRGEVGRSADGGRADSSGSDARLLRLRRVNVLVMLGLVPLVVLLAVVACALAEPWAIWGVLIIAGCLVVCGFVFNFYIGWLEAAARRSGGESER